jgi:manganese/zinc/iron transport system permease protein
MSRVELETAAVIVAVAAACAVPGVFLVLRRMVMVGDAISHVLLLGIVVFFFFVQDLASPWLMVGATATGVLTVAIVEMLQRTRLVKEDAAIGLTFPILFSLGAIIASLYFRNTHLDIDLVLLGSAELAFLDRLTIGRYDIGPRSAVVLIICFFISLVLLTLFYKEIKLATFDSAMAASFGFAPLTIHYGLMTCVSVTTVAAFDAVGPVLVLAFFAVPPATAYLLTDRLGRMIALSVLIGVLGGLAGTAAAFNLDTNMAGTVATVLGIVFGVAFLVAPHKGLIAKIIRWLRQRREFFETILAIHLQAHEGTSVEADESRLSKLHNYLDWSASNVSRVVRRAKRKGLIVQEADFLKLTPAGRDRAAKALNSVKDSVMCN